MKMFVYQVTGWRYYYRRYLGWLPVQFCMVCGKAYWGGFPRWEIVNWRFVKIWEASYMDYCSTRCCEQDMEAESAAAALRAGYDEVNALLDEITEQANREETPDA